MRKPPKYLKRAGRNLWLTITADFELEKHRLVLLESLCRTVDKRNQAEAELRKHRSLTTSTPKGGIRAHPCVGIVRDFNISIARLTRELNLSEEPPESRPPKLKYGGTK